MRLGWQYRVKEADMDQFKEHVVAVELLELAGRFAEAERAYLDMISSLDESDKDRIGGLHINLGQLAERQDRFDDAVEYYKRAITLLEGSKGESGLQCAHSHYNTARLYRVLGDARYETHARRALELYMDSPLASQSDVKDAQRLLRAVPVPGRLLLVSLLLVAAVAVLLIYLFT
jgi:tetratricopeptide (TPR) repeat protein